MRNDGIGEAENVGSMAADTSAARSGSLTCTMKTPVWSARRGNCRLTVSWRDAQWKKNVDSSVDFRAIMLVDDDDSVTTDKDKLAKASVTATVLDQFKGPKVRIFKYRNKTGYRRKTGHRQPLTRVRVDSISA